jgi:integrase
MAVHLDRVDSRSRLKLRRDPYWQRLSEGRHIGYRRMTAGSPGTWLARRYDGERYHTRALGDFASQPDKQRYDAAKAAAEEWFAHMDQGGAVDPGTVRAACESYVEYLRREKGDAAADDAEGRFRRLVYGDAERSEPADPIARVELSKLTKVHVAAWRERLLKRGGAKASFNRNVTALRAALNMAKADSRVASDAAWTEKLKPIEGADAQRTLYLDRDARRALIACASEELKPLLQSLDLVPVRVGEIASARASDLDIRHRILRLVGKTGTRDLPLGAVAFAHFRECAKGKLPSAWLVGRADGSQWKKEAWRDQIKEAVTAAGLPSATVAYTLRHSVITDLVTGDPDNGRQPLDLFTVAQISGTSVAMIEKHYGKLRQEHARAALEALAKA